MDKDQLKTWRSERGLTLEELAQHLNVAKNTVWRWEKGDREIPSFLELALETVARQLSDKK